METGLKNKKALITGGGTGIGKAISLALAKEGVHICIASRKPHPETIEKIRKFGVKAIWIQADVSEENEVKKMVKKAIEGLKGIDFYINNVAAHWDEPITKIKTDSFLKSINTNLSSCIWACREVARYFISKGNGGILIIGSTGMYVNIPKSTSYKVSKAGLKSFMELLAVELAPFEIRVNMITPGSFNTKLMKDYYKKSLRKKEILLNKIPMQRIGDPEKDIGQSAAFLLSDKLSPFTTGSELIIDGGEHLNPYVLDSWKQIKELNI